MNQINQKLKIYWDVDDVILNSIDTVYRILPELMKDDNLKHVEWNMSLEEAEKMIAEGSWYQKSLEHKDWCMKCLGRNITKDDVNYIFSCDTFWRNVGFKDEFLWMVRDGVVSWINTDDEHVVVDNYFVTKGGGDNAKRKIQKLYEINIVELDGLLNRLDGVKKIDALTGKVQYYTVDDIVQIFFDPDRFVSVESGVDKGTVNMKLTDDEKRVGYVGTIQIDDNIKNLVGTNADLKILVKNLRETDYNGGLRYNGKQNNAVDYREYMTTMDNLYVVNDMKDVREIIETLKESKDFRDVMFNLS